MFFAFLKKYQSLGAGAYTLDLSLVWGDVEAQTVFCSCCLLLASCLCPLWYWGDCHHVSCLGCYQTGEAGKATGVFNTMVKCLVYCSANWGFYSCPCGTGWTVSAAVRKRTASLTPLFSPPVWLGRSCFSKAWTHASLWGIPVGLAKIFLTEFSAFVWRFTESCGSKMLGFLWNKTHLLS